jgi:hypothetical protein
MTWRVAQSLKKLLAEVDARWPDRRKDSDGTIGDTAHQHRKSDHDPNSHGVVCALDITHDPKSGCDSYALAEVLRASRDPRIEYVISNRRICSSVVEPWAWRSYNGSNPHDHHVHISVKQDQTLYDDASPWDLDADVMPEPTHVAPAIPPTLRQGDHGDAVEHIQEALTGRGLHLKIDGLFGPATFVAVKTFQASRGLVADGIVGPQTWAALSK